MSTTFTVRGASTGWVVTLGSGVINMETVLCTRCGLLYALPEALIDAARQKGHGEITWRCPNNSCTAENWGYHGTSEVEKAKEEAGIQRARAACLAAQRDQARAEVVAQKAAKTRFKNERDRARTRAAAAVCPCCNRSFKQLRQHMASKHPDYQPDADA